MCGRRCGLGLVLLVLFFSVCSVSSWADVVLTDEEWAEIQAEVQAILQANRNLEIELENMKKLRVEQELNSTIALEERQTQIEILENQLKSCRTSLTESIAETNRWKTAFWVCSGILITVGIVGGIGWLR